MAIARQDKCSDKNSLPYAQDYMVHAGAEWLDQEVVEDGKIITSREPKDLPAFCRAIIAAL